MKAEGLRRVFLMAAAAGLLLSGQRVSAEEPGEGEAGGEGIVTVGEAETGETALPEEAGEGAEWQSEYGAAGVYASGEVNDIKWSIDMNGKLTVNGTGDWGNLQPWYYDRYAIKSAEVNITGLTDASNMFQYCSNLTDVDFRGFDTSSVTNMANMFYNCDSLNSLDLSSFKTSSVKSMYYMFFGCNNLEYLNLSSFDITFNTEVDYMFSGCYNLKLINAPRYTGQDISLPAGYNQVWRLADGTEIKMLPKELNYSVELRRYDKGFASYDGYDFYKDENGNVTCRDRLGNAVINDFKCDGSYTYYFQADGTAMKNRLTYHPDGVHVIYFDENGHEVFSNFANVKRSIEGKAVDDYCFFDVFGYLYVDVVTYDKAGEELYYANPYGVLERNGWFQFSDTVKCADGTP